MVAFSSLVLIVFFLLLVEVRRIDALKTQIFLFDSSESQIQRIDHSYCF